MENKTRKKPARSQEQNILLGARLAAKAMLQTAKAEYKNMTPEPFCLLIDDIKLLRLSVFIQCYVSGDLNGLILAGDANTEQLQAAWQLLKLQYHDACCHAAAKQSSERQKLINTYILFINRVRLNIEALQAHQHEDFINELREDGFNYPYTATTLPNDLQCIANELIGWEVKKEQLEQEERDEMERNGRSIDNVSEEYFLEQLAELRKFEGYNTPVTRLAEKMTVYDYCISTKRYTAHVNQLLTQRALQDGNG